MVVTDGLTGLYRLGFAHEHLDALIKDVAGAAHPLAVGVIRVLDVDAINKAKGHAMGDRVLRQAGAMIGRLVRAEDVAARIGGATFGIILPDTREPAASAVCRRIAGVVGNTDFGLGEMNPLRLAIGCTEADPTDSSTTLFARAAASPI
ncbi:MAG: GGDEF domain-containing protein [Alphaproteobacteria bacterium]